MPDPGRPFVSCAWVESHLADPNVKLIDGSWYLPNQNRNAAAEFAEAHIPGAIFLDIDLLADHTTDLPHMLLDETTFGQEAGALGIPKNATLVVYDGAGLFSAPRVRWMLQFYGARDVVILEGGLPQWKAEGRPLESGRSRAAPAVFEARCDPDRVIDIVGIRRTIGNNDAQIVDARAAARFTGAAPEPRPELESGHMPGSASLPFTALVADGRLKGPDELRDAFGNAGVDLTRPVVASCGSGVTAAILVLGMETLGKTDAKLYDGSWSEYAAQPDSVIEKG